MNCPTNMSQYSVASRTLWFGRIPGACTEQDLTDAVKEAGTPEKISIVGPRGCAYVTMPDRRSAFKIIDRLAKDLLVGRKQVKLDWATIPGIKDNDQLYDYWESAKGVAQVPFSKLPSTLDTLLDGAWLDVATLPGNLKGMYNSRGERVQVQQPPPMGMMAAGGPGGQMAAAGGMPRMAGIG